MTFKAVCVTVVLNLQLSFMFLVWLEREEFAEWLASSAESFRAVSSVLTGAEGMEYLEVCSAIVAFTASSQVCG